MPVRIRITDFQSVADAQIVVDRFTAVTGANNSGKTATMRAIQGVFANTPGDAFVRHGAERLAVEIDFGDGHHVKWSRGPKLKPTYVIDGKEVNPGRGVPEELQVFGIAPVRAGSAEVWPQIAPQFTGQVFLLDLPGSGLAEAVADVARVGRLTNALRLAETDKRSATSELKLRAKDVGKLKDELADMAGLDSVEASLLSLERLLTEVDVVTLELAELRRSAVRLAGCRLECDRYRGFQKVHVPPMQSAVDTRVEARILRALSQRLATARQELAAVSGITEVRVPPVQDVVGNRVEVRTLRTLSHRLASTRKEMAAVSGITKVHVPAKPAEAAQAREELRTCRRLQKSYRAAKESLGRSSQAMGATSVVAPLRDTKVQKLAQNLTWLRDLQKRRTLALRESVVSEASLRETRKQFGESVAAVRGLLGTRGECPTCSTIMGAS